jgi:hypothetical protein
MSQAHAMQHLAAQPKVFIGTTVSLPAATGRARALAEPLEVRNDYRP